MNKVRFVRRLALSQQSHYNGTQKNKFGGTSMQIALLILNQMIKFFFMLMMGYAVVKTGVLKSTDSKILSAIAIYLVTPCVIINAFQIEYTTEAVQGLLLALAAAVCIQMIFLCFICTVGKKLPAVERASIMYSICLVRIS